VSFLENIVNPEDLKKLSLEELEVLSSEIRELIISTVLKTGGHLASSLGAVELSMALHYVFDSPTDKLVWDVGHQAYAHKILTGRKDKFHTLRKLNGISGFPHISESPHDAITVGHSSTSISAGLGMSASKCLKNDPGNVVCVIGDGSMTAGMSFEALNHAGDFEKRLIVILNDNAMSISPNVGALSSFLSRKLSGKHFQNLRKEFGEFLKSLPKIGDDIYKFAKKSEESFKSFVTPGMLFEALNFDYFGPIDGHRLDHLIKILNNIKTLEGPILLHVITKKGKGYKEAEENPTKFHGIPPSLPEKTAVNLPKYTKIFGKTLCQMAEKNKKVTAITAAMPDGTGLVNFCKKFPKRFFDVGIAEQHAVTFSAGLAIEGHLPFVVIYSSFLQRAYDQIFHDVCLDGHHVIFALDRAGIVGEDGPTHHGLFDLSYLRPFPNITIMAPSSGDELVKMMKTAESMNSPVAIRYPRGSSTSENFISYDQAEIISPLKAKLLRDGRDILIIAIGSMVAPAEKACDFLEKKGYSPSLIDARFAKPLDSELLASMAETTDKIITIEENVLNGGFGSAILELFADLGINNKKIKRMGINDTFVPQGTQEELRNLFGLNPEGILKTALSLLENDK